MNKTNDNEIKVKINSLNINGEGVALLKDKKICMKYVLPEEVVAGETVFCKNNFIKAKLKKLIASNSLRQTAKCPYYTKCGGCDFQHISYKNSLLIKKDIIKNYFSDIFDKEVEIEESDKTFSYRNKASFLVKNSKIGLQEESTNNLVEIDKCLIVDKLINETLNIVRNWLKKYKNDCINHLVIRTLNKKLIVTLVVSSNPNNINVLINLLNEKFGENYGLYLNFNSVKSKILSDNFKHINGLKELDDVFLNIKYSVHPYSFMQVNNFVRNKLYNKVLSIIEGDVVIEGYSGIGLLTSILATKAKKVIGIEINKKATENANKIKKENCIVNIDNINGDCKIELTKLVNKYKDATFLIDPPRSGCDVKTLQTVKDNNMKRIIYISCNAYTLKQNLKFLSDKYKIDSITVFDMFPQTSNCEILTTLSLKK